MDINKKIEALGIVPVVVLNDADDAVPLCKALAEGGLPVAEITFRTAAAECDRLVETLPAPGGTVFSAGDCFTWTDNVLKLIDPIYVDRTDNESSSHNVLPFLHARALSLLISRGSKYMD